MKIVCVFERGSHAFTSCPAEEVQWLLEASVSMREMRRGWQPGRDEGYLQLLYMPSGGTDSCARHLLSGLLWCQLRHP